MTRAIRLALCLLAAGALAPAAVAGTAPALVAAAFLIAALRWPDAALLAGAAFLPVAPAAAAALLDLPAHTAEIVPLALLCGLFLRGALRPAEALAPAAFARAAAAFA